MLHTVINLNDVFYNENEIKKIDKMNSTNPFDYISTGYHIDNLNYYGGKENVSFKCDFYGNTAGDNYVPANK